MKIRLKARPEHKAHRLTSFDMDTWPEWLQGSDEVSWIMEWKDNGWLLIGDTIYMQGQSLASGLGVVNDMNDWEVIADES